MNSGTTPLRARKFAIEARAQGEIRQREDSLVIEEPLEIRLEKKALAVTMRTPGHDVELVLGLLCAEEIIRNIDDVATVHHCVSEEGPEANVINVTFTAQNIVATKAERSIFTSSSCGVCGKKTIETLHATAEPFSSELPPISTELFASLPSKMRAHQEVFESTGGLHAAAIFSENGELVVLREDVGRHNAVDKCVGHLLLSERLPLEGAILLVSGRASFEIVQKALVARIQTVLSVSAPSSLAVELARASNMLLCGFLRDGSFNVYAEPGAAGWRKIKNHGTKAPI